MTFHSESTHLSFSSTGNPPTLRQFSGRSNSSESGVFFPRSPPLFTEQFERLPYRPAVTRWLSPYNFSISCEPVTVALALIASAIIAIMVQLLTSSSISTTSQCLLSFGILLELLGIALSICSTHFDHREGSHRHPPQRPSMWIHFASRMLPIFILTGILPLAAAVVVETLKMSLGTGIAMGVFLVFGVIVCVLALVRGQ